MVERLHGAARATHAWPNGCPCDSAAKSCCTQAGGFEGTDCARPTPARSVVSVAASRADRRAKRVVIKWKNSTRHRCRKNEENTLMMYVSNIINTFIWFVKYLSLKNEFLKSKEALSVKPSGLRSGSKVMSVRTQS